MTILNNTPLVSKFIIYRDNLRKECSLRESLASFRRGDRDFREIHAAEFAFVHRFNLLGQAEFAGLRRSDKYTCALILAGVLLGMDAELRNRFVVEKFGGTYRRPSRYWRDLSADVRDVVTRKGIPEHTPWYQLLKKDVLAP